MQIKAILIKDMENPECFWVDINRNNHILIKMKLKYEIRKIIDYFKKLKDKGDIKSILKPINKKIQKQLDRLIELKKTAYDSIKQINEVFK